MTPQSTKCFVPHGTWDIYPTMRKNFPDSKLYTEGLEAKKRWWHLW